jgi:hypothetical protein
MEYRDKETGRNTSTSRDSATERNRYRTKTHFKIRYRVISQGVVVNTIPFCG